MRNYNFFAALEHAKDMYGVELNEDLFETYAMSAWNHIGNKDCKLYKIKIYPKCDPEGGWYVTKPCNLDSIEAITLNFESALETSPVLNHIGSITHPIELRIESNKRMPNALYISGKLVKYRELGDKIYFTEPFKELNMLYKGLYTDEDGYPYLNNKEVEAIALYCAYVLHYKLGIRTKDSSEILIAQLLKKDWLQACNAARVPETVSQNEMNEVLDTLVRQDVHRFGQTYKSVL